MDLLNMLLQSMTSQNSVGSLSQKTDVSPIKITKLLKFALPILMAALTKNASSGAGARSLMDALGQHTSTLPLADQLANADAEDGAKILGHIFGDQKESALQSIAQESDLSLEDAGLVLDNIAPALMSSVSAATNQAAQQQAAGVDLSDGLDFSDILGVFGVEKPSVADAAQAMLGGNAASNGGDLLSSLMGLFK